MARVLYITNGLSGGLNANYELARRLALAGHEVSFLGHGDLGDRINEQGYSYTRVGDADHAMSELRSRLDHVGRLRSVAYAAALRRQVVSSGDIKAAVAAEQPDALIIDLEAHYSILATRSLGIPTVLKNDFFSLTYQRGIPPLHSEQAYPTDWRSHRVADLAWARAQIERFMLQTAGELHPAQLARRWAPFRYNTVSRRDLRAVARARDIRLRDITSQQQWLRPHTYPTLPVLTATAREIDFVTKPSPNEQWIGPLVFRGRVDTAMSTHDRDRWEQFRDRNRMAGRPMLYCSFGTMLPDTTGMLSRVVAAVRSRPNYDLVVGLGGRNEQLDVEDDANILVLDYAPQLEVLEIAGAAVIHGGINTINECITFAVPMILEQTGPTDGPGNASRVEHHGVGMRANLATIESAALATSIDSVLADSALQNRVTAMQAHFERYEQDGVAEKAIELLLADRLNRTVS